MKNLVFILTMLIAVMPASHAHTQKFINQAQALGFEQQHYATQHFLLTAFARLPSTHCDVIRIYIEGDGNSWKTKYLLSDNPTPKNPVALRLAMLDTASHVLYLARPGQYTPFALQDCDPKYWSSHRYAPEVITAMAEVLDQLSKQYQCRFVLIGFSGGGSIAALLAAQRNDIAGLITLAGNLNRERLDAYLHYKPMMGSLDPIEIASRLKNIPQYHYSGAKDKVVPPWVAQSFSEAVDNPSCVKLMSLKKVTHNKGWEKDWPRLAQQPLVCD